MKRCKIWSIITLLILSLSASVTLISCSEDTDQVGNPIVNGIYYRFEGTDATITRGDGHAKYSGDIDIPSTVKYKGKTYNVTSIGWSAFLGYQSITKIFLPNSVTSIEEYAFTGCTSLEYVDLGDCVTSIGNHAFRDCSSLYSIFIPNSVTSIGRNLFSNCTSLYDVTIPNSVTQIDYEAFYNCSSLTSIIIPKSVTSIEDGAFSGCSSVREIYCHNTTPPTCGSGVFSRVNTVTTTLHVPAGTKEKYANSGGWLDFQNIQEDAHFYN